MLFKRARDGASVQLLRHDAYCLLHCLLVLKSGQPIANRILKFCYSYDQWGVSVIFQLLWLGSLEKKVEQATETMLPCLSLLGTSRWLCSIVWHI